MAKFEFTEDFYRNVIDGGVNAVAGQDGNYYLTNLEIVITERNEKVFTSMYQNEILIAQMSLPAGGQLHLAGMAMGITLGHESKAKFEETIAMKQNWFHRMMQAIKGER